MQNAEYKAIKSFTDLNTWKAGHLLVLAIYKMTKLFPSNENFSLTNQIQRAAVSITSNIAEGFSRYTSLGSLTEVQNQLLISKDLGYIDPSLFNEIATKTVIVSKLLNGLIKSVKKKHNT